MLTLNAQFMRGRYTLLTLLTQRQCDDRKFSLRNPYRQSHSSISTHLSLRRPQMASVRIAHMSPDEVVERLEQLGWEPVAKRNVHSSRKEKHPARTRGKDDEVRDERQFQCMRRSESKEQDRAERRLRDAQHSIFGTRDETSADKKDQRGTSRARTTTTSNPRLGKTPRKDIRMGVRPRQTVLRVGGVDSRRGKRYSVALQLKKFATHVEQSLGTSQKVTSSHLDESCTIKQRSWSQRKNSTDLLKRMHHLQAMVRQRKTKAKSSASSAT